MDIAQFMNDDSRDLSIRITERLIAEGYVTDYQYLDNNGDEQEGEGFEVQDLIHEELNKSLSIKDDN